MKAERAKRPELAAEVSDEDWNYFLDRWERYKVSTKIAGEEVITQLLECCCDQLRRDHHRTFLSSQTQRDLTEDVLKAQLRQIAVQKRNLLVNRFKVFKLKQDRGEPVRKFAGRVRGLASVSGYSIKSGANDVSYTEAVIRDQVVFGLADPEIQRDVLAHEDADKITLEKLLSLVEGKMSSQTSQGLMSAESGLTARVDPKPMKCRWCGEMHPRGKVNCKAPGHKCSKCEKTRYFEKVCRSNPEKKVSQQKFSTDSSTECSLFINQSKDLSFKKEANKKILIETKERPARACIKRRGKYRKKKKKRTDPLLTCENVSLTQNLLFGWLHYQHHKAQE